MLHSLFFLQWKLSILKFALAFLHCIAEEYVIFTADASFPHGAADRMCSPASKKAKLEFKLRGKLSVSAVAAINECLLF